MRSAYSYCWYLFVHWYRPAAPFQVTCQLKFPVPRYINIARGIKLLYTRGRDAAHADLFMQTPRNPSNLLPPWHMFCVTFLQQFLSPSMQTKEGNGGKKKRASEREKVRKVSSGRKTKRRTRGNCFRTKAREVIWGEQTEGVVRVRRE